LTSSDPREVFRLFLENVKSDVAASFDFLMLSDYSELTNLACARILVEHASGDCANAGIFANVVKQSKMMGFDFSQHVANAIEKETILISKQLFTKPMNWNQIVALGAFVGELHNSGSIGSSQLVSWVKKVYEKTRYSDLALTSLLLFIKKVDEKLKQSDTKDHERLMNFARAAWTKKDFETIVVSADGNEMAKDSSANQTMPKIKTQIKNHLADPIDWERTSTFGRFLAKNFLNGRASLKRLTSWFDRLQNKANSKTSDSENAKKLFVENFVLLSENLMKRDRKLCRRYSRVCEKYRSTVSVECEPVARTSSPLVPTSRPPGPSSTDTSRNNIAILLQLLLQGDFSQLHGRDYKGGKLAKAVVAEVKSDFESIFPLTKAAHFIYGMDTKLPKVTNFKQKLRKLSMNFLNSWSDEAHRDSSENFLKFIASLYNFDVFSEADMAVVVKRMNATIIPCIRETARHNFQTNRHGTGPSVHEMIREFEQERGGIADPEAAADPPSNNEFVQIVKKVLSGSAIGEDFKKISEEKLADFLEYFVDSAINNPQSSASFARASKEISGTSKDSRIKIITLLQQRFEESLQCDEVKLGVVKIIGELFNVDLFTSKIILSCVSLLEKKWEGSSDALMEAVARKVIQNQDQMLFQLVRSFILKNSMGNK
jgi:hypothetical protein